MAVRRSDPGTSGINSWYAGGKGDEPPRLAGHGVAVQRPDPAETDLRAGQARLAQAPPDRGDHRGRVELAVDHRGDVGTPFGLPDLEFAHRGGVQQRGTDDERVYARLGVPEQVVGPPLHAGAQRAAFARTGRGEAVGQLVADDRLGQVVQVGDQDLGRGQAVRDGLSRVVDALRDAGVAGEREHRLAWLAVADQALG